MSGNQVIKITQLPAASSAGPTDLIEIVQNGINRKLPLAILLSNGVSGYSGYSGLSGVGIAGISGYSGFSGAMGFSGYSGKSGYSGFSGATGAGVSGYSGQSGFSGFSGISGFSGAGLSGFSGFSGAGLSGYSGFSGIGTSGFSGFSGAGLSGYSGFSGAGTSGYSGFSGTGTSGFSGFSGISGFSGTGSALTVKTLDGITTVSNVSTIKVTNGSLIDNGGGNVTLNVGTSSSSGGIFTGNALTILQTNHTINENDISTTSTSFVDTTLSIQLNNLINDKNNVIRSRFVFLCSANTTCTLSFTIKRDGTTDLTPPGSDAMSCVAINGSGFQQQVVVEWYDSPGDLNQHTYNLYWKTSTGTAEINFISFTGFSTPAVMTIDEIGILSQSTGAGNSLIYSPVDIDGTSNLSNFTGGSGDDTVGSKFTPIRSSAIISGARIYWGSASSAVIVVKLWNESGTLIATANTINIGSSSPGFYNATFPTPYIITSTDVGKNFTISMRDPSHFSSFTSTRVISSITSEMYWQQIPVYNAGDTFPTTQPGVTNFYPVQPTFQLLSGGTQGISGVSGFSGFSGFSGSNAVPKGTIWNPHPAATTNQWVSVCYGNGLFVAISGTGTGNRVMTSPDGVNWTSRTSAADLSWQYICYGKGLFVVVGSSGTTTRIMTSPDGITWTLRNDSVDNSWDSVCYGNGIFVAVSIDGVGNRIMTSPDGITWTSRTSPLDKNWISVCYGNNTFVSVASDGTSGDCVMTSPDGITWTQRVAASSNAWESVCYGNGLFVAVSASGTGTRVMTSPDGITWTSRTSAADKFWKSVCYGEGLFVAVSYLGGSNNVMTSLDGITWASQTTTVNNAWYSVCYGNGIFVAVNQDGGATGVFTSGSTTVTEPENLYNFGSGGGTSGYSGFSGKSGFSGFSGISGFSGFSGTSGYSGFSGTNGVSGFSGFSGTNGVSGFSGFSGISGYSGFSGISGYSGFSGVSGYSGISAIATISTNQIAYATATNTLGGISTFTFSPSGGMLLSPAVVTSGAQTGFTFTGQANTGLTATVEDIDINFNLNRIVTFNAGTITTQRAFVIQAPTYAFPSSSTITNAATFAISGPPVLGTNATITNNRTLWVQGGVSRFDGAVQITNSSTPFTITQGAGSVAAGGVLIATGGAHLNLTTGTEFIDIDFQLSRTVQHAAGALTTQRAFLVRNPTYSFLTTPSTITTAATMSILGAPVAGGNATITNAYAFWVQAGNSQFDGGITLGSMAAPGSPNLGNMWFDSTSQSIIAWQGPSVTSGIKNYLSGTIYSAGGLQNYNNFTAATSIPPTGSVGTLNLPANFWIVGKTVRFSVGISVSCTATPTLTLKHNLGSDTTQTVYNSALPSGISNGIIYYQCTMVCRSTGATGHITVRSVLHFTDGTGSPTNDRTYPVTSQTGWTIDTTATSLIDFTAAWSAASVSNNVGSQQWIAEVLN